MKDECINCGAWKGLHHWETNQCPRNGQEAPIGKLQEWDNTVYQEDNTADLRAEVVRLTAGSEAMQEDARNNTATINMLMAQLAEMKAPIEDIKIYCNNPSAWDHYDDGVSEKIRAILKAAGMA